MKLDFPWELKIDRVHSMLENGIEFDNKVKHVKFIYNDSVYTSSSLRLRPGYIQITELELSTKHTYEFALPFSVTETSPIPYIHTLGDVSRLFAETNLERIPEDLFRYNPQISRFCSCFQECERLTKIPKGLFKYSVNGKNFASCFNQTNIHTIPKGLFSNTKGENFEYCFADCKNLKQLDHSIFPHNFDLTAEKLKIIFKNSNVKLSREIMLSIL